MTDSRFLKFAGRRLGRPLRGGRLDAMKEAEQNFLIPADALQKQNTNPKDFFGAFKPEKLWLEIGFGNGEHMTGQAERHLNVGFIGCEPFLNGVSAASRDVVQKDLKNVRIWPDEALAFLMTWQTASVDRLFLLFSDPWPKTRQNKRRVIQPESVELFARLIKPGGILRLATDHDYLAEWMLLQVSANKNFEWQNAGNGEWQTAPSDWIETRYQQKAAQQGRSSYFMDFIRI